MTDRPIIFADPMVRALLDGRKTQTRRLATSPLRRCQVGDRLYVRENFYQFGGPVAYAADGQPDLARRMTPSIHMPRWASRLTLVIKEVRFERLNEITEEDAIAEGCVYDETKHGFWVPGVEHPTKAFPWLSRSTAREMYAALWDTLHGSGAWLSDPHILVLQFRVDSGNIDRLAA